MDFKEFMEPLLKLLNTSDYLESLTITFTQQNETKKKDVQINNEKNVQISNEKNVQINNEKNVQIINKNKDIKKVNTINFSPDNHLTDIDNFLKRIRQDEELNQKKIFKRPTKKQKLYCALCKETDHIIRNCWRLCNNKMCYDQKKYHSRFDCLSLAPCKICIDKISDDYNHSTYYCNYKCKKIICKNEFINDKKNCNY